MDVLEWLDNPNAQARLPHLARPLGKVQTQLSMCLGLRAALLPLVVDDADLAAEGIRLIGVYESQLRHGLQPAEKWFARHGDRLGSVLRTVLPDLDSWAPQLEGMDLVGAVLEAFPDASRSRETALGRSTAVDGHKSALGHARGREVKKAGVESRQESLL